MPVLFPSRAFRTTRTRISGLYLVLGQDDLTTTLPTGQTLTLTRASGRTIVDSAGQVSTLVHSEPPFSCAYNSADAVWEPALSLDAAGSNLCLQSEDFSTTWAAVGTPTRTAASKSCGNVALDLIGDDAAGTLEGYTQTVTFTGNAVKGVSIFLSAGTSTSTVIRLRDTTASADRLLATITWASGVPTVTMTTGTHIGTEAMASGTYRFHWQTTSVTAANTNSLQVYPATTNALAIANTGTVYAGGVQAENNHVPTSYVKTTTGTTSRSADAASVTTVIPIRDFTVYARVHRPIWASLTTGWPTTTTIVSSPTSVTNGGWLVEFDPANQTVRSSIMQAGSGFAATQAVPSSGVLDICAQFEGLATGAPRTRLDVGSGFSAYSSTTATIWNWESNVVTLGGGNLVGLRKLAIAPGLRTLAEMRGAVS